MDYKKKMKKITIAILIISAVLFLSILVASQTTINKEGTYNIKLSKEAEAYHLNKAYKQGKDFDKYVSDLIENNLEEEYKKKARISVREKISYLDSDNRTLKMVFKCLNLPTNTSLDGLSPDEIEELLTPKFEDADMVDNCVSRIKIKEGKI